MALLQFFLNRMELSEKDRGQYGGRLNAASVNETSGLTEYPG